MMILKAVEKAYQDMETRGWDKIYWAIDMHGTCIVSNYKSKEVELINDDVLKTLLSIRSQPESVLIMFTSAYQEDASKLWKFFFSEGVYFDYINENPMINNTETGCFDNKFYYSILLDDKAGFDPNVDWKSIRHYLEDNRCL